MGTVDRIAALIGNRVLVVGSLPPGNRDLDLLVRPGERRAIEAGLGSQGFASRHGVWARFAAGEIEVVDLTASSAWRLPATELDALFGEAIAIEASGRVCRPAPGHALLILARRVIREGPRVAERRLDRARAELAADPGALAAARTRAVAWGARWSLDALERGLRGERLPSGLRWRAVAEELSASRGGLGARVGACRAILRRPRWGSLVVVSGPDPGVCVAQADDLVESLRQIGIDSQRAGRRAAFPALLGGRVVVVAGRPLLPLPRPRAQLAVDPERPAAEVRAEFARAAWTHGGLFGRRRRRPAGLGVAVLGPDGAGKTTLIAGLERSFPLPVRTIYMGLYQDTTAGREAGFRLPGVALLTNLARQRLRWLGGFAHRIRGRLVLFDRYTYDALLADPGSLSRLGRLRRRLLGHACPDPDLVVILDAPAQVLFERKGEHDLELLDRHRRGLLELRDGLPHSVVIDATRDSETVLRDVSAAIWERYGNRAS